MNEVGSKICYNCYSNQDPASRFCDNCGHRFVAEVIAGGDIFSESKTFIRRQVVETRPLFWASIIIVGTLSVFGFAQAGVFSGEFGRTESLAAGQLKFSPQDETTQKRADRTEPVVVSKNEVSNDALLDSTGNVFDMGHQPPTVASAPKIRISGKPTRSEVSREKQIASNAATLVVSAEDLRVPFADQKIQPKEKAADNNANEIPTVARVYVRGPMGGCYYLTASGSKRYVDRSVCK